MANARLRPCGATCRRTALLTLIFALLGCAHLVAQSPLRVGVLPVIELPGSDNPADMGLDLTNILHRSLVGEVTDSGYQVVAAQFSGAAGSALSPGVPDTASAAVLSQETLQALQDAGADIALLLFYRLQRTRLTLIIRAVDVPDGVTFAGTVGHALADIGVYNSVRSLYGQIADSVDVRAAMGAAGRQELVDRVILTSPQTDVRVFIGSQDYVGTIRGEDGIVLPALPFRNGQALLMKKEKPGYYSDIQRVELSAPETRAELSPLVKKTRLAATVTWTTGQAMGAGVGLRYYFTPDNFFTAFDNYFYVQDSFSADGNPVYHDDMKLSFGTYLLLPYGSRFRFGLGGGVGVITTYFGFRDIAAALDPYLEVIELWLELNYERVSFFLRPEVKWATGGANALLPQGIVENGFGPSLSAGMVWKW